MSDKTYEQTGDYIPKTDAGFRDWLGNFSTLINADPGRFGLDVSDATVIANLYTGYNDAYTVVQSPATRTTGLVTQKDAIKASAIGSCRVYAVQIKANKGVDNQSKIELGLHINDTTPTPIPAPSSAPLLSIVGAFSGQHEIRYSDENTPASRKKPEGVIQLELRRTVETGANPDPDVAWPVGLFTKNPVVVDQEPADSGMTATYFGRWVTRTGLVGPWSLPIAMTIAFGGPVDVQQAVPVGGGTPDQLAGGDEELKIAA